LILHDIDMIFDAFKKVKALVLDVDGVLTDGHILVNEHGEQWRTFHVRDGYAIQLAVRQNMPILVITGGRSEGVRLRLEGLGVKAIKMGVHDKVSVLQDWAREQQIAFEDILFMGDDMPDLEAMKQVGLAVCPSDAIPEIKDICQFITLAKGGQGAVREVIESILKLQGKWPVQSGVTSI
jgi:3-deoxy-D-manno-octulosonate 8-phosphate phosphatase (KDO 8-P phosphatase)